MMDGQTILTFSVAFFIFAISPGPANLTIFSKTISNGPVHGIAYGGGLTCSMFLFVILTGIGFNTLARQVDEGLRVIQYIGAFYLVYSGITMWCSKPDVRPRIAQRSLVLLFVIGFILNIYNPTMPIFYLALLPNVVDIRQLTIANTAKLLLVIAVIEAMVVGGYVFAGFKAKMTLADPNKISILNRGAGVLMVGIGLLIASR